MASLSKKIALNTIVQVLGKVATTTLGVIITIILTRYLGPAGFGTFTFILVFVAMFGTVADWGLTLITVREASKNDQAANEIIGNVLVVRLSLAITAAIISVIVINFLPYDFSIKVLVAIASLTLISLSLKTSFQIIFNIKLRLENSALADFSANVLTLIVVIFVVYFNLGITGVVIGFLLGDIFAASIAAFLGFRLLPLKLSLLHKETKFIIMESLPMGAILVVFTIYNRIDTVILSYYKGQEAVGLYGAAYRIFEVLTLGAAYFSNAVLPLISNLAQKDKSKLVEVYQKSFVILLILGIAVASINYLLAPIGIAIIAGSEFFASIEVLRILSLALVVAYFNHLNGYTLIALGKQWYSFIIAIFALTINITLNLIFVPIFSYKASAYITFITEGFIVLCTIVILRKVIGLTPSLTIFPKVIKEFVAKKGKIFEYD